jgi:hypothetical protein
VVNGKDVIAMAVMGVADLVAKHSYNQIVRECKACVVAAPGSNSQQRKLFVFCVHKHDLDAPRSTGCHSRKTASSDGYTCNDYLLSCCSLRKLMEEAEIFVYFESDEYGCNRGVSFDWVLEAV